MGLGKQIEVRKVKLGPLKSYFEGKDFLGEKYWTFLGICFGGLFFAGLVPLVLIGPAYAGISICFLNHAQKRNVKFEDLFKGFDYFLPSMIAALFYVGGSIVLFVPFLVCLFCGVAMMGTQEPALVVPGILLIVLSIAFWFFVVSVITMVFMFGIFLVVDKKMDGGQAMTYALKGVWKNFWGVIGCSMVGQVVYFVAALFCFFPALLVLPILMAGHFVAYWKIFGIETDEAVEAQVVVAEAMDASHGRKLL